MRRKEYTVITDLLENNVIYVGSILYGELDDALDTLFTGYDVDVLKVVQRVINDTYNHDDLIFLELDIARFDTLENAKLYAQEN